MKPTFALASLILLCASFGAALGGGFYEHFVLVPLWSKSPPHSFSIIQPGTGVPLQRFWIPVHSAITLFLAASLFFAWREKRVRTLLLVGTTSYLVMRGWSALYFIPEMLAFQRIPLDSPAGAELTGRVATWTFWSWFREPLDVVSLLTSLLALHALPGKEPEGARR